MNDDTPVVVEAMPHTDNTEAKAKLAQMVQKYIQLRDTKAALKKEFDGKVESIDKALSSCEAYFMTRMKELGLESLPTEFGVPYQSRRNSCSVNDKQAFKQWLHDTGNWECADIRASKAAVEAFVEEHKDLPPGLNWHAEIVVNVRRK
jgi:hypothetical protein